MRAILHLGTYKTGSSSLQNQLYANRDLLRESGFLYPQSGLIVQPKLGVRHFPLISDFMKGKQGLLPARLADEFETLGCSTVIFSAEPWSAPLHQSHLTRFVCALEDHGFDDIQGVVLFRNLADYHISHYREFTVNQKNSTAFGTMSDGPRVCSITCSCYRHTGGCSATNSRSFPMTGFRTVVPPCLTVLA